MLAYLVDKMIEWDGDIADVSILWIQHENTKHLTQLTLQSHLILFTLLSLLSVSSEHHTLYYHQQQQQQQQQLVAVVTDVPHFSPSTGRSDTAASFDKSHQILLWLNCWPDLMYFSPAAVHVDYSRLTLMNLILTCHHFSNFSVPEKKHKVWCMINFEPLAVKWKFLHSNVQQRSLSTNQCKICVTGLNILCQLAVSLILHDTRLN